MSTQMELPLVQRRTQCRQRPVVERLLEIIRRQGVGTGRNEYKGRVMFRPELQRPVGFYMDLCSGWECMNRFNGFFTAGYGNRAEAKRLSSATHHHHRRHHDHDHH